MREPSARIAPLLTMMRKTWLSAPLFLSACATAPAPAPPASAAACPITASSDWKAWVNAMPGPNAKPTLIVTGKVTVPTGGYTFAWRDLRTMESHPVQIVADLEALPPEGPATQAIETHDLRGEWPATPPVGSVTVTCGQQTLARISPVETAQ